MRRSQAELDTVSSSRVAAWPPLPSEPRCRPRSCARPSSCSPRALAGPTSASSASRRRAGISRTAFYFYFRDKRELLIRLTEDVTELLYLEADRWYSGEGDDEEEMREALVKIAALYEEHSALLRIIVEVSTYDEEVATFWRSLIGRFVEATRMRIEAEQAAGKAPAFPAAPSAFALVLDGRAPAVSADGPGPAVLARRGRSDARLSCGTVWTALGLRPSRRPRRTRPSRGGARPRRRSRAGSGRAA